MVVSDFLAGESQNFVTIKVLPAIYSTQLVDSNTNLSINLQIHKQSFECDIYIYIYIKIYNADINYNNITNMIHIG